MEGLSLVGAALLAALSTAPPSRQSTGIDATLSTTRPSDVADVADLAAQEDLRAAWEDLRELLPGDPARTWQLASLLERTPGPLAGADLQLAWSVGVEAAQALRLEDAIAIQTELEARHPAEWSAMDLALSLGQAGRRADAEAVLRRAIAREEAQGARAAVLWNRLGLSRLGAGDERQARDHLGRALARGSGDAAVVLARLDLDAGELDAARAGFRSRLYDEPPGAWALRGWGLSLLPPTPVRSLAGASAERDLSQGSPPGADPPVNTRNRTDDH